MRISDFVREHFYDGYKELIRSENTNVYLEIDVLSSLHTYLFVTLQWNVLYFCLGRNILSRKLEVLGQLVLGFL